uniref:Hes family bHLH transcription factor 3 n=1 Tax=Leptobrachium leishanense TaxID=445787 RepID=A0A8C5QKY8_9ANUR
MVTTPEVRDKMNSCNFRKISKPLMEKKRRARINVSLEELKTLLENNYSQNIRKRKMEKADILELTVKYLKTLQNSMQGVPLFKSPEYQAGFRNCLYSVGQFLMKTEEVGHTVPLDLTRILPNSNVSDFNTMDSSMPPVPQPTISSTSKQKRQPVHSQKPSSTFPQATTLAKARQDPNVGQSKPNSGLSTNQDLLQIVTEQSIWRPW